MLASCERAGETPFGFRQLSAMKRSQRAQEIQYLLLLRGCEVVEIPLDGIGFAAITLVSVDRSDQVRSTAIVQQEDALPQSPQGSRAELVSARAALRDVIRQARAHVMDFNIGIRIHWSPAQR